MIYTLQYLDDHKIMTVELKNKSVRKVSETLFLVKIKRKTTIPALIQTSKHIFRVKNTKKWWLCEVKEIHKELVILEFHKGEDVWAIYKQIKD